MTHSRIAGSVPELATRVITSSRLIALAMIISLMLVATQPAHAQSSDTWKSVAIIGGSTAAGTYIGHKVGGATGAWIGAGVGASAGYAIDRRRRANEYYNQSANGYYDPNGYYGNGGYNGNGGYYPNGGYYGGPGGPYNGPAYPSGLRYQGNNYSGNMNRRSFSERSSR
ncbi:MAG: hypothetical protein ACXVZR_09390 [Terriglobales bacterium]